MTLKKILSVLAAAIVLCASAPSVFADDDAVMGEEYTGFDNNTVNLYDSNLDSEYALDVSYIIASFEVVGYSEDGGFAMKMIVNDQGDANDYYFLTLATNSWATVDSGYGTVNNPIEPTGEGIYNVKFNVSDLGEISNIKFNLWQGTAKLFGVAYLDAEGSVLHTDGTVKTSDKGCYTPEDGKVEEFLISSTTQDETTEAATGETQVVTISSDDSSSQSKSSIMSKKMPWLFNLLSADVFGLRVVWILVGVFFLLGAALIVTAITLSRKHKRIEKKDESKKKFKEKYGD